MSDHIATTCEWRTHLKVPAASVSSGDSQDWKRRGKIMLANNCVAREHWNISNTAWLTQGQRVSYVNSNATWDDNCFPKILSSCCICQRHTQIISPLLCLQVDIKHPLKLPFFWCLIDVMISCKIIPWVMEGIYKHNSALASCLCWVTCPGRVLFVPSQYVLSLLPPCATVWR